MRRLLLAVMAAMALLVSGCVTASVLPDGRVLLVSATGAKLFDPATGLATLTGAPSTARAAHAAAVLKDGRVLLTGGAKQDSALASAEIWDPATGAFTSAGDMTVPRSLHTATTLNDGRVLIVGGSVITSDNTSPPSLTSAELFDPRTGTFAPTGSLATGRGLHSATLLADGRVLILGGSAGGDAKGSVATAEIYDPVTGTFTVAGSHDPATSLSTATLLADGRVLVAGGFQGSDSSAKDAIMATAAIWDPATGAFTSTGDMTTPRAFATATRLRNDKVLIAGGAGDSSGGSLASAEIWDPATGTFSATGDMTVGRSGHVASRLPDGRVLVVAGDTTLGSDTATDMLATAEVYDPATGTWSAVALPQQPVPSTSPEPSA